MKTIKKLRALLVLLLAVGWVGNAWAENWSGNKAARTFGTGNTVLNVTGDVTLTGTQTIPNGATVTINASGANRTINRGAKNIALFTVENGGTLIINGGTYKITIDGKRASYTCDNSTAWGYSPIVVKGGGTATLTDVTIKDNYLHIYGSLNDGVHNTHGGAIFVRGTLTCNNCTFTNCRADQGGAIAVFTGGTATINGGSITKCIARHRGGGALVANTATRCGTSAAVPSGRATLTLSGVTIGGSTANANVAELAFGGGAYSEFLRANCIVKDNTVISYNKSNFGGHGICVADMGDIELRASDIHHNTPYNTSNSYNGDFGGGGVYIGGTVTDGATAYIYADCKIHNNSGARGAGVFMASNMVLNMQGGSIYNNTTYTGANYSGGGGGVYMQGTAAKPLGQFNMSGGSIYSNTATSNPGGGVYLGAGTVTISDGTIRNNTAQGDGGGIYNALGNVTMSGGNIYSNNANGSANNGGGLYLASGSFTMSGGKIYTNTAKNGAGAYLAGGSFTMSGSAEMYSNNAATNGGGIYLANGTPTVKGSAKIYTNTAGSDGGGLYLAAGTFKMQGGEVYGNVATRYGGGAYLTNSCTYTMTGGSLGKTGAAKNSAKRGGGLYDLGKFTMSNGNIVNNEATDEHGGGAYISTSQATSLTGGTVAGNTAKQHGGGLYITGGSAVTVNGVSIYGNTAAYNADGTVNGTGNGGGVCLSSSSGNSFTMTGGAIGTSGNPNKALNGGGAYISAPFTMSGGSISYNKALNGDGGGAYINTTSAISITNGTISENTADRTAANNGGNGGGFYMANGSVTVENSTFDHNQAFTSGNQGGEGGGIRVAAGSMTIKGTSSFTKNEARLGGAASVTGSFTMEGGVVGGSTANANKAGRRGGGIYVNGASSTVLLKGGEVSYNEAITATDGAGGGIFVNNSSSQGTQLTQTVKLNYNKAHIGGGAYINAGNLTINGTSVQVNNNQATGDGTEIMNGSTPSGIFTGDGGGMYVVDGNVTIKGTGVINNNYAGHDGGAIFTKNAVSSITIGESGSSNAFTLDSNHADNWGGGIRVGGTITVYTGTLSKNYATYRGGGVFVAAGTFNLNGGTVGGATAEGNYTTAEGNALYGGGGLFVLGGTANINGGAISGNHVGDGTAGGGIYMGQNNTVNPPTSGTCYVYGGTIGGASSSYANSATYGGGIYSDGGTIHVTQSSKNRTSGNIAYNEADYGGGIYTNGSSGVVYVDHGDIQYNTATDGGGIYANRGLVDFSNGNIVYNNATNEGGGIYVNMNTDNTYGTLNLKGTAVLNRNHVPDGHKGGGVYLKGVVVIGEVVGGTAQTCSVTADDNFAHTLTGSETVLAYTPDNTTRNNIYLPNPEVRADHTGLITVVENTIGTNSHIGFSVPRNHLPVIYCAPSATSMAYLDRFTTGAGHDLNTRLFDDTQHYLSVHYPDWPEAFDRDHVYLYGFWPEAVTSLPATGYTVDGDGNVTISSNEGLAWLISTVNGYNSVTASDFHGKTVDLVADVDMSAYGWVPVGFMGNAQSTPAPFNGTFNGNGHTITGIDCMVYGSGVNGFIDYGLFGFVESGTVENVLLKDAKFYLDSNPDLVLGALVGELSGGTLCNSEASATLVSRTPDATIGGAVGKQTEGTVHSVIGIGEMTGGTMGGLVGVLEANGDLYNSFANPMFHRLSTATTQYYGVLAAVNKGTIENCYSRLQNDPVPSDMYFGWFVGDNNTVAKLKYCYTRGAGGTPYFAHNGSPAGSTTGYGYYADNTEAPYLYARRDNQVTIATGSNPYEPGYRSNDKQMLYWLNNWVEENSNATTTYTKWMRTTSKTINDDLPVLKMPFANSIVGTTTTAYLDYGDINTMMAEYRAVNQALCLYKSKAGMNSNTGSGAKLYINEDVSVIPADRENGEINAYVGITIANIAGADGANPTFGGRDEIDWHMFSTPLQAAPLGIDYHGDLTSYHGSMSNYNYYSHAGMPYYRFMEGDLDGNIGYFPDRRYGERYPAIDNELNNTTNAGNYYKEWDFYTYYEPEYHWINFKRNSQDHWHENAHDVQIHYFGDGVNEGNETNLVQGRGYLVAFADSATYLQCHGALNTGADIMIPVTSRGYYSTGYNLLGNPYQACLDFNAFAEYNSSDEDEEAIWNSVEDASYRILSETAKDYVTFAYGSSENPFGAGRYIHPHQGFMVYSDSNASAIAYFEDIDGDDPVHMRAIEDATPYRGAQVNYPLVNLFATEGNGNETMVTVELGRPDKGGAKLMSDLRVGKGQMWCHYDDADWKLAFTRPGVSELPIRFSTVEDTEYTMTWSTHNGEFGYLHLIDNMTGADIDCLAESEYRFSSKTSDYKSRFKLVFGYTGIEENDEAVTEESEFAFMMGDELVVNGDGTLELFDVNGRRLMSTRTQGTQTTLHLPQVSTGVYVLRMTGDGQVKTQKMVINQ